MDSSNSASSLLGLNADCSDRNFAKDMSVLRRDYRNTQYRKYYTSIVAIVGVLQLVVMFIEVLGTLRYPGWLTRSDGSRKDARYHTMTLVQTVLVIGQVVITYVSYKFSLKNLAYEDRIWTNVPLLRSPLARTFLLELFVLSLHEPPFLVLIWRDSYKLQTLALLRMYTLFGLFKGWYGTLTQTGRIACFYAKVSNNKVFHLKYWMKTNPGPFLFVTTVSGWFFISVGMYVAEAGITSPTEAMWIVFITMTTVGYGDITPTTFPGKMVAVVATIFGWLVSALLISIVSRFFELNQRQTRVVDCMVEANLKASKQRLAAIVIQKACRYYLLPRGRSTKKWHVKQACYDFRRVRRKLVEVREQALHRRQECNASTEALRAEIAVLRRNQEELQNMMKAFIEAQMASKH
eukprot:TRINITY_DN1655_c0_g1_i2.p1 TRINITY_DN1655_c0_g1~~TRINITY_DN1655_c0_g1_i2.p1  ORF type:complete len:427 (+),score=108.64 TRINITY_DN1655_c0_g1_i2:66-1283(+)